MTVSSRYPYRSTDQPAGNRHTSLHCSRALPIRLARTNLVPDLLPHFFGRLPQRARMFPAHNALVSVVVEVDQLIAPPDKHQAAGSQNNAVRMSLDFCGQCSTEPSEVRPQSTWAMSSPSSPPPLNNASGIFGCLSLPRKAFPPTYFNDAFAGSDFKLHSENSDANSLTPHSRIQSANNEGGGPRVQASVRRMPEPQFFGLLRTRHVQFYEL